MNSKAFDLGVGEVVDRDQLEPAVGPLEDRARDQPADAAETVDRNLSSLQCLSVSCESSIRAAICLGGEAEMLVDVRRRSRGAEAVDADAQAVQPGVALPAERRPGLDRHAQDLAVARRRAACPRDKPRPARRSSSVHGMETTSAPMPCASSASATSSAISTSDPVAIRMTLRARFGGLQAISAARAQIARRAPSVRTGGRFCRVSASTLGLSLASASAQHSAVSTASAGRIDVELRDRAQALQMLDRLVGRPVLAKADRIVGHARR